MRKTFIILFVLICSLTQAQEITNAFDDLQRKGVVSEEKSEMRVEASKSDVSKFLQEYSEEEEFFCFAEDRMHDIRLTESIPVRWIKRNSELRTRLSTSFAPGEFGTWQVGVYSPFKILKDVRISFCDLINQYGEHIDASSLRCFNLQGVGDDGEQFEKSVNIPKGKVQALWIGADISEKAHGTYKGKMTVSAQNSLTVDLFVTIEIKGVPVENHGDNEGWRKSRLRWLDSKIGNTEEPTAPYVPIHYKNKVISYLGGTMSLSASGLPAQICTHYNQQNLIDGTVTNQILAKEMRLVVETERGIEYLKTQPIRILNQTKGSVNWSTILENKDFEITCNGKFSFDGYIDYKLQVKALNSKKVKDIRLEIPYTSYASTYMMGLGHRGGFRPDSLIRWKWDVNKHQDKIWMGNVNAGLNFCFMDENYVRPLVNIYYSLGKLKLPVSWGNVNKGGITIQKDNGKEVRMIAYSGERNMKHNELLNYNFRMLITPVKPINIEKHFTTRFYHSNSDVSSDYIPAAIKGGANNINVHHKKDIYPFINYPYYDASVLDLKKFINKAHSKDLKVRLYYTTRELTVKIPELWALRSLGDEIIHDGLGKDARTLIHPNGPNEWLCKNLKTHFIPAWFNAFKKGKYAGEMDVSVITTPDSRWNNYYLKGLDWMVKNLGLDGIYIDDSALDRKTLQRARRILDIDGKQRLIDLHSWNHMNKWAGYANSLHLYLELLPYIDRTWIGEGFGADNTPDFWLVEMSGIPFGLMSATLEAKNEFRGLIYGMLPRLPWSGNPVPLWHLFDAFGLKDMSILGFWNKENPIRIDNKNLKVTIYKKKDKALVVIANWDNQLQRAKITIDEKLLGFKPSSYSLPEISNLQSRCKLDKLDYCDIEGKGGVVILLSSNNEN